MEQYLINIPNEKATSYKLVSFIIAIINLAAFVFYFINAGNIYLAVAGVLISVFCVVLASGKIKWSLPSVFTAETGFALLAFLWLLTGNYFPAFLMLVFAALGFYTNRQAVIRFTQQGIYYPSMPVKLFPWTIVDFAMIKDEILTIELKDNRIFQFTLQQQEAASIDEAEFNSFCKRQTAASNSTA